MCLVRLKQEGEEGKKVITMMNKMFWEDIENRIEIIGARVPINTKKQLGHLFYGAILAYDEVCII